MGDSQEVGLDTIQAYLAALGYAVELKAIDLETGETAADVIIPSTPVHRRARRSA